jgi:predicted RNase H-like nuclease (RuvC/YqgF family)
MAIGGPGARLGTSIANSVFPKSLRGRNRESDVFEQTRRRETETIVEQAIERRVAPLEMKIAQLERQIRELTRRLEQQGTGAPHPDSLLRPNSAVT